jgi:endoglucanase
MKVLYYLSFYFLSVGMIHESSLQSDSIHLNQLGFLPKSVKTALVFDAESDDFVIKNTLGEVVYSGKLSDEKKWVKSNQMVRLADFSSLQQTGKYFLTAGSSKPTEVVIADDVYEELVNSAVKYYYFNRASTMLEEQFAGPYARPLGHPDTLTYIHSTAASKDRPSGSIISTPFGWYDAGDYNKYIVNSGVTMYTLMEAYSRNERFFVTRTWNIPESKNGVPDLLDEIRWNLNWMSSMQDSADGGVYHKNTTANFEGFITPASARSKRYVTAKSTAATLDFAAVMAKASKVYNLIDPEFSEQALNQAKLAWNWAVKNPDVIYTNPKDNVPDGPAILTGEYGDSQLKDEFFWAATELYLATKDQNYADAIKFADFDNFRIPAWQSVEVLGILSLLKSADTAPNLKKSAEAELKKLADVQLASYTSSPAQITLDHFRWGSNSDILNQSMILINAYDLTGMDDYLTAAVSGLDYILGKNATGYCFVTGFGKNSPVNVHHRPSVSDNLEQPIPGMLVGGPNPRNMDMDCGEDQYPHHEPARAYVDLQCSYTTNEVAINWNAPLVYVSTSIQNTLGK